MKFEWDLAKEKGNISKHGVTFKEAKHLFTSNVDYLELYDAEHSQDEDRFIAIGPIRRGLILVVFTERVDDDVIRIISARWAEKRESALYRQYSERKP